VGERTSLRLGTQCAVPYWQQLVVSQGVGGVATTLMFGECWENPDAWQHGFGVWAMVCQPLCVRDVIVIFQHGYWLRVRALA